MGTFVRLIGFESLVGHTAPVGLANDFEVAPRNVAEALPSETLESIKPHSRKSLKISFVSEGNATVVARFARFPSKPCNASASICGVLENGSCYSAAGRRIEFAL